MLPTRALLHLAILSAPSLLSIKTGSTRLSKQQRTWPACAHNCIPSCGASHHLLNRLLMIARHRFNVKGERMATKPILLTVDDDPEVLRAIERDLRQKYGAQFRVLRAEAGATALEALKQVKLRNEPVALFIVDQRMPHMTGVEFLEQARELFPDAKRVLLTAYADTDAAVRAINTVKIDYYLMKPWDPPEEHLYPVLQDLLDDWLADYRPLFQGVRVIGHRWSPQAHDIKDFLARNQIPYRSLDIETNQEASALIEHADLDASRLPLVLLPDGPSLVEPTNTKIAEKRGLST